MKKNNKKGFTLVELVIVVAVMAVLVAVAIPTVGSITGTAKTAVADSNARAIESVLKLAEANVSKTGDGVAYLSAQQAAKAIFEAKLGLKTEGTGNDAVTPTFFYDPKTGTVVAKSTTKTAAEGVEMTITFEKVTVNSTEEDGVKVVAVEWKEGTTVHVAAGTVDWNSKATLS